MILVFFCVVHMKQNGGVASYPLLWVRCCNKVKGQLLQNIKECKPCRMAGITLKGQFLNYDAFVALAAICRYVVLVPSRNKFAFRDK